MVQEEVVLVSEGGALRPARPKPSSAGNKLVNTDRHYSTAQQSKFNSLSCLLYESGVEMLGSYICLRVDPT